MRDQQGGHCRRLASVTYVAQGGPGLLQSAFLTHRSQMGRPPRVLYAGAHYHVVTRGNRRGDVFLADDDRRLFLALLATTCAAHQWRCLSYCLMGNHYHLVVLTERATLSAGMHRLNGLYARAFNEIHGTTGHVFESRFYPKVIEDDRYLAAAIRYVETNPVRAQLCRSVADWSWNSYGVVVGMRSHRSWFDRAKVLSLFGANQATAIERYIEFMSGCRDTDAPSTAPSQTRRERDSAIVDAHVAGLSTRAIARRLGTSTRTVRRALRSKA